ncbi:MAG: murein L,D-transpeptidase [Sphingomonadaceae bacterium]|nr:murein L,D-transpeptidase [Sphingomonadaceae bacterium]
MKNYALLALVCALAACQQNDENRDRAAPPAATETNPFEFTEASGDIPAPPASLEMMPVQIALSRLGFSPGVIDGKQGDSLKIALRGFQAANNLEETGKFDAETKAALGRAPSVPVTRRVIIPASFAQQQFFPDLPKDAADQAKLPALGYRNLVEALAERFHTTPETLVALNSSDTSIGAGKSIIVPNIADVMPPRAEDKVRGWDVTLAMLGVAAEQPEVVRLVVDKSAGWLRAFGEDDRLIAQFPVTTGSEKDPLPLGNWTVKGVARNPDFHYNPELFWDVSDNKEKQILKPGPNSPVGVVWIDLSKPHYGVHGTSEPATIGRVQSHGCVRLTNWDAAKLAGMVKPGVKVEFVA